MLPPAVLHQTQRWEAGPCKSPKSRGRLRVNRLCGTEADRAGDVTEPISEELPAEANGRGLGRLTLLNRLPKGLGRVDSAGSVPKRVPLPKGSRRFRCDPPVLNPSRAADSSESLWER